jgi:hypothetical protein
MATYGVITAESLAPASVATTRPTLRVAGAVPIARTAIAWSLIALIAVGSVAVWTVVPLGGLWLAAQLTDSFLQPSIGWCLVTFAGIPAAMALAGKALTYLERVYMRVTGTTPIAGVQPAWRRSISDARADSQIGVVDRVIVASVLAAVITIAVWFLMSAGTSA